MSSSANIRIKEQIVSSLSSEVEINLGNICGDWTKFDHFHASLVGKDIELPVYLFLYDQKTVLVMAKGVLARHLGYEGNVDPGEKSFRKIRDV